MCVYACGGGKKTRSINVNYLCGSAGSVVCFPQGLSFVLFFLHTTVFEKKNLFHLSLVFLSLSLSLHTRTHAHIICICMFHNDTAPSLLSTIQICPRGRFISTGRVLVYSAFCENTVSNFSIIQHHKSLVVSYHFAEKGRRSFRGRGGRGCNAIKATPLSVFSRNFFAVKKRSMFICSLFI